MIFSAALKWKAARQFENKQGHPLLYAAKNAGRNRVELIGPEDMGGLETVRASMRSSPADRETSRRQAESDAA